MSEPSSVEVEEETQDLAVEEVAVPFKGDNQEDLL